MPSETVDILIVDDRLDGLIALESVLTLPKINLIKAQSGREALALLSQHDFGLILLDVQMPEMDGFETARRVRQNPRNRFTPIIFVTAINKDDRYIFQGYEAGAVDYIFKPFDPIILRSKVGVFLDLFRKSRQLKEQAAMIRESEMRERYLRLAELEVESLKRYRNLADAIPHLVWRARADGTLDYFNRGWSEYTGLSLEQSVGTGWQGAFEAEDLARFLKQWMICMQSGKSFDLEARIRGTDKIFRYHWLQVVAETSQSGACVAWLGTCTDIHDRKMTEQKLIAAEKAAQSANQSKTTFLANMSHEIRTPMNAILGFTELIRDPNQDRKARLECVDTVQRNGQQLLRIIDEILDISKVEVGHLELENVPVSVDQLLKDLKALMSLQTDDKGLRLTFSLDSPIPSSIYSDPTRLRQILVNIIANAVKFTAKGGIDVSLAWKPGESESGTLCFQIRDSGIGVEPAQIERLFQPFMQGDSSTTRHFGGSGLGLALSREFARALGGDVVLESTEVGVGSIFRVEIATRKVESSSDLETLNLTQAKASERWAMPEDKPLQGVDVLLVDDLEDNRDLLSQVLTMAGAKVDLAENGQEGVDKALNGEHSVVLMDIQMPLMDGYQATKALRAKGFEKPIIALTAYALREERQRCIEAGCDDHLTKPIRLDALIDQVSRFVHKPSSNPAVHV